MEAALRTVYEVVTGKELENIDFTDVRGLEGIKEAEVDIDGTKIKIAVANSLKNARELLEMVKSGKGDYKFIEVMCAVPRLYRRWRSTLWHKQRNKAEEDAGYLQRG